MDIGRFRRLAARMDSVLVERLGDPATLGDGTEIKGAFTSPFIGASLAQKAGGAKTLGATVANLDAVLEPTFTGRAADLAHVKPKAPITIELPAELGGGRYEVVKTQPSGDGFIDLILRARANAGS